jgi:hypothetical protein
MVPTMLTTQEVTGAPKSERQDAPRAILAQTQGTIANTDANYRALRDGMPSESYTVSNLTLKRDIGAFTLRSGSISFLPPVLGRTAIGVFAGEGTFALAPALALERNYLRLVTDKEEVSEDFTKLVLYFSDETYEEIKRQAQQGGDAARASEVWRDFSRRMRTEDRAFENIEAELLTDLYNPKRLKSFSAYISGKKYNDLRYFVRPYGALDEAPEEVALFNIDPTGAQTGIWYLGHLESEYKNRQASSEEDKRVIDAEHYQIKTTIDRGEKLTATTELTFTSVTDGERVLYFDLLPTLRVSRVAIAGQEIGFIQEGKKADGSFYVVMPEALVKGQKYKITMEYRGDKVVQDAGGGNFAVGARTSWYPTTNSFKDRATYDLTFIVPNKYTLVGVGKPVKDAREGDLVISQWTSETPLAVAGFNYGLYKKKAIDDPDTKYKVEGYATSELPDMLKGAASIGGMSPVRLMDNAMVEAQNSMRIYTRWFGELPYGRVAITQQPQLDFGQSWPTLVYLPILAFFDSTQRWMMLGSSSFNVGHFIQELTPHEVAHQWWGHIVGWSSLHDQWLSEGFADFSASLYLQFTEPKPDKYLKFWERSREAIVTKNQFGIRANDAGPIWMGFRLHTHKTPGAYNQLVYPKGGYILHMLRWMMYDAKTGDERFIAMMRDFVKTHFNQNASTESFKRVVEKHMTPDMDLDGNRRLDWFFNAWVYGTELPRYKFDYTLTPSNDGKTLLKGTITQSDVSPNFKMRVPVYLDFDGKIMRLGAANITGNNSVPLEVQLPQKPKRVLVNAFHDVLAVESVSSGK